MSSLWPGWVSARVRRQAAGIHPRVPRSSPPSARGRPRRDDRSRGQSLVELALVTPILLLLLLGAVDLGRLFYAQITVTNAAREGAMVAALTPTSFAAGAACDTATNAVTCAATREGQGGFVSVAPADVAMACTPSCTKTYGTTITVTVTGHFQLLTPIMWVFTGGPNVTFDRSATTDVIVTPAAAGIPSSSPSSSPSGSASTDPSASASASPSASPTCPPPFVGFTTTQSGKNNPVLFTSISTPTSGACAISYWRWDFGDGNTDAGAVGTTSHDYGNKGRGVTFNVTLTVTTPSGTFSYVAPITTQS
jgi:Flp pilus assembly protein TadG